MNISQRGIDFIKLYEGVRQKPYKCSGGYWTVGVGHLITRDILLPSSWNRTLSHREIDELLKLDLVKFTNGVQRLLPMLHKQCEFDSIVSFAFNLGLGTLQRSTVRSALLRGDKELAMQTLLKYCRAGGKIVRGLQIRRKAEVGLFNGRYKYFS